MVLCSRRSVEGSVQVKMSLALEIFQALSECQTDTKLTTQVVIPISALIALIVFLIHVRTSKFRQFPDNFAVISWYVALNTSTLSLIHLVESCLASFSSVVSDFCWIREKRDLNFVISMPSHFNSFEQLLSGIGSFPWQHSTLWLLSRPL